METIILVPVVGLLIFFLWHWYRGKNIAVGGFYGAGEEIMVYNNTSLELKVDRKPFRPSSGIRVPKGTPILFDRGALFGVAGRPTVVEITGSASSSGGKAATVSNNTGMDVHFNFMSPDGKILYKDTAKAFEEVSINLSPEKLVNSIFVTGVYDPFNVGTNKNILMNSVFDR